MPTFTHRKIITSGNVIEVYHSEKPFVYGVTRKVSDSYFPIDERTKKEKREKSRSRSIHQTRVRLNQLLNSNVWRHEKKDG